MRHRLFTLWCGICLVLLVILCAGYVLRMDLRFSRGSSTGGPMREVAIATWHGRLRCLLERSPMPVPPPPAGLHASFHYRLTKISEMRFDVTGFDSHWMIAPGAPSVTSVYLISCPLWFAMLAALVSPAIWLLGVYLRRRRGLRGAPGFDVVHAKAPIVQSPT